MRAVRSTLLAFVLLALTSDVANATLFSGTWVPIRSATAEYCRDGSCAQYPLDALIGLGPPPGPGALVNSNLTIGFRPLGFESFNVSFGSVVGEATLAAGVLTIRGATPGFEEHDLAIRIVSDQSLSLDGFLHISHPTGLFDVRIRDVGFAPIPEPASALMVGLGLTALATRARRAPVSAPPLRPSTKAQQPTRSR